MDADWASLVQSRIQTCSELHREKGVSDCWLQQIPSFLAGAQPLYPPDFPPAIISGDVHQYHLLVVEEAGRWRLSGLFDFDDARIGFHEYDLAASGLFLMHGRPELLRTFLRAYGYPEVALDEALRRRLLAYTLLHRYRPFNWVREELVADPASTSLEQLALAIYAL